MEESPPVPHDDLVRRLTNLVTENIKKVGMAPPSIAGPPRQPIVAEIDPRYSCYLTAPPQGPQVAAAHLQGFAVLPPSNIALPLQQPFPSSHSNNGQPLQPQPPSPWVRPVPSKSGQPLQPQQSLWSQKPSGQPLQPQQSLWSHQTPSGSGQPPQPQQPPSHQMPMSIGQPLQPQQAPSSSPAFQEAQPQQAAWSQQLSSSSFSKSGQPQQVPGFPSFSKSGQPQQVPGFPKVPAASSGHPGTIPKHPSPLVVNFVRQPQQRSDERV